MPNTVIMQLDAVEALAARLVDLGAELAADGGSTRAQGARLGQSLTGPAADELTATGLGWADLVETLATRTGSVAATLALAIASYRSLEGLLTQRMGAGPHAAIAR